MLLSVLQFVSINRFRTSIIQTNKPKHRYRHDRADIPRKNDMHRYQLALWSLLATLLLAACGATQTGAYSPPSGTSFAIDPTLAPATGAAAPTDAAPASASNPATPTPPHPTAAGHPVAAIKLEKLIDDLKSPVFVTHAGDKSGRMFVVEKKGTIAILLDGARVEKPFLDISDLVDSSGSEPGACTASVFI